MACLVACDPGKNGALFALGTRSNSYAYLTMPLVGRDIDGRTIMDWLQKMQPSVIVVEHSQAISGVTSTTSAFAFGKNFGVVLGIVQVSGFPFVQVKPRVWQKEVFTGTDPELKPKERAAIAAYRLYPDFDFKLGNTRAKKPHDGVIDAALIAQLALRTVDLSE